MTAPGWGDSSVSSCVFSVQMFPLSLPNDLDIKSCRFPVVNLPRGTPGTCTAWLRLRPTPTSQNWHKLSFQKTSNSLPFQQSLIVQFWNLKGHDRKGLDLNNNSPLDGRSRLFFFISTQCLYYVLSSLILTFCKYFWISLLTVWRMRRIRSHFILSETMQISPRFPLSRSHHLIVPVTFTSLRWISIWLNIELVCCWAGVRFMLETSVCCQSPGATHLSPVSPLVTRAGHWVAAKMG